MKGYYRKIYLYILGALVIAAAFWMMNSGILVESSGQTVEAFAAVPVDSLSKEQMEEMGRDVLVLYDEENEQSLKYKKNLERVFRWMNLQAEFLPASRKDAVSYSDYDLVTVAFSDWEELIGGDSRRMLDYVDQGGRLFLGLLPDEPGSVYRAMYRRMGIIEYGEYYEITGIDFLEELVPGSKGQRFEGDAFKDTVLGVQLEEQCQVLVSGIIEQREIPMVWKHPSGAGEILVFNATAITGDGWTGVSAGCIAALLDHMIYPVVNAKTVFIDDFPSPQYNVESQVIKENYNRTVREFFRDIWWPDMQSAARRYNYKYVGLFMATYDDVVNPEECDYVEDSVEKYFGNSLLDNDFELGAHGYNHQSLALEGQVPKELGYHAWNSIEDMKASLIKFREISDSLFPGVKLYTYVPPSNYLSQEGRQAVKEALPDLQVLSGVYTMEGEEGSVYVQDFSVAEDGIVEYPRTTSGMQEDEYDRFLSMNIGGLYGVFSHFIHPDDILDEERSGGKDWQTLYEEFCAKLQFINESFQGMRAMTAVQAAEALRRAEAVEVAVRETDGRVEGFCNGFTGEAWCYFRTEKQPEMDNDTCRIRPVSSRGDGDYYLIQILDSQFSFSLKE